MRISSSQRAEAMMKIKHNITYIATLRNYEGDRIFSPIRSCILIKCFDKEEFKDSEMGYLGKCS